MIRIAHHRPEGFTLVELAVATVIYSMGLGSLSLMMLAAVSGTSQARHQTAAATQAASIAEMIAMSSDAYGHHVDPPGAVAGACHAGFCDAAAMAAANVSFWQSQLANALPNGTGLVCRDGSPDDGTPNDPSCDGSGSLVIKIFWSENHHEAAAESRLRRMVSRLPW